MSRYFWPILTLPLSHFATHPGTPKVRHTSRTPRFLVVLVQEIRTKAPCTNSLSIVRKGVFCLEGFVRGGFCSYPLLSEYICYNRKLKITCFICMIKNL